jgi:L-ribulose-5-phosphate 4-epimerase
MLERLKKEVLEANLDIVNNGLVIHTWGNVSGRDRDSGLIVIKPSGISYKSMKPDDMVVLDADGNVVNGKYRPSTDAPTHLLLYNTWSSIGGVVHTHSTFATAWAQAGEAIPPLGTTHADHFYGKIPCTRDLCDTEIETDYEANTGKIIVEIFDKIDPLSVPSVLVKNHGPFCWGTDAENAVYNAVALEEIARIAFYTMLLGKSDKIDQTLLEKHFRRKHGSDSYYGQGKSK